MNKQKFKKKSLKFLSDIINAARVFQLQKSSIWKEFCWTFCNNLNGKITWKIIEACICTTKTYCCTPETNTTLLINILQYKTFLNKYFKIYVIRDKYKTK